MPSGGSRTNGGRKYKWNEPSARIWVPASIGNDLVRTLDYLWHKGFTGKELMDALSSTEFRKVKKYDYPVSAGAHSTSSVGGDSMNTDYESVDLHEELIGNSGKTIILPVIGDSMIEVGIYPGDWLIVEEINPLYQKPEDGDVVIASIGDEVLVKRFKIENGEAILVSENKSHKPIRPSESSIYITGIVKSAIRRNL
jgi:DNA polymerase V